jgi:hypothetical protein
MPDESIHPKVLDLFDKSANIAASSGGTPLGGEKLLRMSLVPNSVNLV